MSEEAADCADDTDKNYATTPTDSYAPHDPCHPRSSAAARRGIASLNTATTHSVSSPMRAAIALARREIVRFFRQRSRIVGSIGTPLVFWLLFGAGLSRSFQIGEGAQRQ